MEINKQLFEDVLSGKLKGIFVMGNGNTYFSSSLHRNYNKFRNTHPYAINLLSYTPEGRYSEDVTSMFDVADFILDTDMKENELKITIPEEQEIDWQESAKQEKIVFKKKDTKPRSWEEYYEQQIANKKHGYYIDDGNCSVTEIMWNGYVRSDNWKNVLPSKELAEAFLAMMQLMSLRQAWISDWKPDWNNSKQWRANILYGNKGLVVAYFGDLLSSPLSFPTQEMAEDFMNCFKDLLEVAKPLI